jgi:hypothetical protein
MDNEQINYNLDETDLEHIINHMIEIDLDQLAEDLENALWASGGALTFSHASPEGLNKLMELCKATLKELDTKGFSIREWIYEPHKICVLLGSCTCEPIKEINP